MKTFIATAALLSLVNSAGAVTSAQGLDGNWQSAAGYRFHFETVNGVSRMIADACLRQPDHADMEAGDLLAEGVFLGQRFVGRSAVYNNLKTQRLCFKESRDMSATIDFLVSADNNTLDGIEVFSDMTGVGCNEKKVLGKFQARRLGNR